MAVHVRSPFLRFLGDWYREAVLTAVIGPVEGAQGRLLAVLDGYIRTLAPDPDLAKLRREMAGATRHAAPFYWLVADRLLQTQSLNAAVLRAIKELSPEPPGPLKAVYLGRAERDPAGHAWFALQYGCPEPDFATIDPRLVSPYLAKRLQAGAKVVGRSPASLQGAIFWKLGQFWDRAGLAPNPRALLRLEAGPHKRLAQQFWRVNWDLAALHERRQKGVLTASDVRELWKPGMGARKMRTVLRQVRHHDQLEAAYYLAAITPHDLTAVFDRFGSGRLIDRSLALLLAWQSPQADIASFAASVAGPKAVQPRARKKPSPLEIAKQRISAEPEEPWAPLYGEVDDAQLLGIKDHNALSSLHLQVCAALFRFKLGKAVTPVGFEALVFGAKVHGLSDAFLLGLADEAGPIWTKAALLACRGMDSVRIKYRPKVPMIGWLAKQSAAVRREAATLSPILAFLSPDPPVEKALEPQRRTASAKLAQEIASLVGPHLEAEIRRLVATAWTRRLAGAAAGTCLDSEYRLHEIPKKSGGVRTICVPSRTLKVVQRAILNRLLEEAPLEDAVHGFRTGRSIVSNSAPHVGRNLVVNLDIHAFFPSVRHELVSRSIGKCLAGRCSPAARRVISELCCYGGALATGAPTSPAVANLVLTPLDRSISRLCASKGVVYTRYADDLTFSGDDDAKSVIPFVRHCLGQLGLTIEAKKLNLFRRGRRQMVTGLVVNDKPNLPRTTRRRLRAAAHRASLGGVPEWQGQPMKPGELMGRLSYLAMVQPDEAQRLKRSVEGQGSE